jgi:hypothetical protein
VELCDEDYERSRSVIGKLWTYIIALTIPQTYPGNVAENVT